MLKFSDYRGPIYIYNGVDYRLRGYCCNSNKYEYIKM